MNVDVIAPNVHLFVITFPRSTFSRPLRLAASRVLSRTFGASRASEPTRACVRVSPRKIRLCSLNPSTFSASISDAASLRHGRNRCAGARRGDVQGAGGRERELPEADGRRGGQRQRRRGGRRRRRRSRSDAGRAEARGRGGRCRRRRWRRKRGGRGGRQPGSRRVRVCARPCAHDGGGLC